MNFSDLQKVNAKLDGVDVKGKNYVMVNSRIMAFRELYPGGRIETEILSNVDGVVVMIARIYDGDGNCIATGHACEKESSSFINRTSYIENAETSAVGRALGMLGIGITDSVASAEEVENAIHQQKADNLATGRQSKNFQDLCEKAGIDPIETLKKTGWTHGKMTSDQYGKGLIILKEIEDAE